MNQKQNHLELFLATNLTKIFLLLAFSAYSAVKYDEVE